MEPAEGITISIGFRALSFFILAGTYYLIEYKDISLLLQEKSGFNFTFLIEKLRFIGKFSEGTMRIVSFIKDHKVIDKIIDHLKLTFKAERPPPAQAQLSMAAEGRSEYI